MLHANQKLLLVFASAALVNACGNINTIFTGKSERDDTPSSVVAERNLEETSAVSYSKEPSIRLGLLIDNTECAVCHIEIHGDVGSVGDVTSAFAPSAGEVFGRWLTSGKFDLKSKLTDPEAIKVSGGIFENYNNANKELPVNSKGKPAFPDLDNNEAKKSADGKINSHKIDATHDGNLILIGTVAKPITLDGPVFVDGDLVIKGYYSGRGTIYVSGRIYVPGNLVAVNAPAFPYPDVAADADKRAQKDVKDASYDALGLATNESIFIADLENYSPANLPDQIGVSPDGRPEYRSIYTSDPATPEKFWAVNSGVYKIYDWYPEAEYEKLYETHTPCSTAHADLGKRSFSRVDAFLFAGHSIGGIARGVTYEINGGVITQDFHVISGSGRQIEASCKGKVSKLNYDYRFRNGLNVLDVVAKSFAKID